MRSGRLESILIIGGIAQLDHLAVRCGVGDRTGRYNYVTRVGTVGTLERSRFLTSDTVGRFVTVCVCMCEGKRQTERKIGRR